MMKQLLMSVLDQKKKVLQPSGPSLFYGGETVQTVIKARLDNLKTLNTSVSYGSDINSIAVDDTYVYVGGGTPRTVRKYLKSDLSYVGETPSYGNIHAIAVDDTYVYVGGETPRTVRKYLKSDLTYVTGSVNYGGNIRAIAVDDTYVYVGGVSTNTVRKYLKSDMSYVGQPPKPYGGTIHEVRVDDTYVYVAGAKNRVEKYLKSDLSYVGSTVQRTDIIYSLAVDDTYLYIGCKPLDGSNYHIVIKYLKSTLETVSESSNINQNTIFSIAVDDTYVYAGGSGQVVTKLRKPDLLRLGDTPIYRSFFYGGSIKSIAIG